MTCGANAPEAMTAMLKTVGRDQIRPTVFLKKDSGFAHFYAPI
jgi:hypothetical protein